MDTRRIMHSSRAASGHGFASSQAEQQVDGAHVRDVIVGQPLVVLHLSALVDEPLLAHLDSLPALHLLLEVEHSLVGLDVVGAVLALLVSEEHLDGGPLSDQQSHPGAAVHTVAGERLGVVAEKAPLSVVHRQTLLVTSDAHFLLDAVFQQAHRVLGVHHQGDSVPIEHNDVYFHYEDSLQDRIFI